MFRMMKLHQNVKGKVLSFAVSLAVLALTIVGAFAVNFKKASAAYESSLTLAQLEDLVYDIYPNNQEIENFFDNIDAEIDFWDMKYIMYVALGSEPSEIAFTLWTVGSYDLGPTHSDGWTVENNSSAIMYRQGFLGQYFWRLAWFYSDVSGYHKQWQLQNPDTFQPGTASNRDFYFGQPQLNWDMNYTIFPNIDNYNHAGYTLYCSQNVYLANSSVITYEANFFKSPVSAYNNVCFTIGEQYYFTFSDQSILQTFVSEHSSNIVPITFQKGGQEYTFRYSMDELVYTGKTNLSGVTNIGAGGVIAWNITPLIEQWYFDSVIASYVEPSDVYRNYFAFNEAIISWFPAKDPAAQYEYYLEQFQNIVGHSYVANPNELPSYITSGNVGFSQDINAHVILTGSSAGKVYFDSVAGQHAYDINVQPSSILIIDSYMLENDFDASGTGSELFDSTFSGYLKDDVDLIIVVEDWETISKNVTRWYMGPVNLPDSQIMSTQDCDYFKHHSYYQNWNKSYNDIHFYFTKGIEDNFIPNEGVNSISGFVFATNRYYSRICNAILAEGFNGLQNALDTITTNQNTFFTGAINSIGAAVYAIDTVGGKLDSIYKYLRYDVNLSNKLQNIVDKLEQIADNTSEQTHDYWFISLFNWLSQFAPSNSDFAQWVSDLTEFEQSLPDPEATPAATIIPFPTVTAAAG